MTASTVRSHDNATLEQRMGISMYLVIEIESEANGERTYRGAR